MSDSSGINKNFRRKKRQFRSVTELVELILTGDRTALSEAITIVESSLTQDQDKAADLLNQITPYTGNALRIGITGVPGVGKSTFIESYGNYLIKEQKKKVAVLAVDPSSQRSGGSILGDKTRMESLVTQTNAFVRPSPAGTTLGGVAQKTRECMMLCEAAGFDVILIETVGVGQSEIAVKSMVDYFLLLMLAGAGDELQGIKRGIMEMADSILITKADGENVAAAERAQRSYKNALHLFPMNENQWTPTVQICSSIEERGISDLHQTVESFFNHCTVNGWLNHNRKEQAVDWFKEKINH